MTRQKYAQNTTTYARRYAELLRIAESMLKLGEKYTPKFYPFKNFDEVDVQCLKSLLHKRNNHENSKELNEISRKILAKKSVHKNILLTSKQMDCLIRFLNLEPNNLIKKLNVYPNSLKDPIIRNNDCYLVALDYCVDSVEAFINHLGYIFCDQWQDDHESKFFSEQYKKVRKLLKKLNIDIRNSPYPKFEDHRKKRNLIHHVHSSKHDYHNSIQIIDDPSSLNSTLYLQPWVSVEKEEACLAYKSVKNFITTTVKEIKKNAHLVDNLLYEKNIASTQATITDRKKLLRDLMTDSFQPANWTSYMTPIK